MAFFSRSNNILFLALFFLVTCFLTIFLYSGVNHEYLRVQSMTIYACLVVVMQFTLADFIRFLVLSIDKATWPTKQQDNVVDDSSKQHTRLDYLKLRLETLRAQLLITPEHRDERLNLKYQTIGRDLWLYGKYFLLLCALVLVTRNELLYHDYHFKVALMERNQSLTRGINETFVLSDVYTFINSTLVNAFNPNRTEKGLRRWLYGDHTTKLGVVRLRQLRRCQRHIGWKWQVFTTRDYNTGWKLPYSRVPYTDKYWRIYEPWLAYGSHPDIKGTIYIDIQHHGYFQYYPELSGYVTLLARSSNNSRIVLDYLIEKNWLNTNTSMLFMDFTTYNVDADIFTIFTIMVERTPLGSIETKVLVQSVMLLGLHNLSFIRLLITASYVIVFLQFAKSLIGTLWHEPRQFKRVWNIVDVLIIGLNVLILGLFIKKEVLTEALLKKVEGSSTLHFLDYREPARVQNINEILTGCLVCLATLRLWKVMQFASVFKLFTSTLYSAWKALLSTALLIGIVLVGVGIALVIINGNNSIHFSLLPVGVVTAICLSFGFSNQISPKEQFYGGELLGLFFYALQCFVLAKLLINVLVSLIHDYFMAAKAKRDATQKNEIGFPQFLKLEFADLWRFFRRAPCCSKKYRRRKRTVAQNIDRILKANEGYRLKHRYKAFSRATGGPQNYTTLQAADRIKHNEYIRRVDRLFNVAAILQIQMELLEHLLFDDEGNYQDDEDNYTGRNEG
ncbi:polycystin-2 [Drosophila busckii]|uniref:polycystin-2 n=1 Tax=Drosophila busckii TaxID=30019 RepID=UPI00083EDCD9|nr:polycystin-2 [Drosophila busckii]